MDLSDQQLRTVLDPIRWVSGVGDFAMAAAESFGQVFGARKAVFVDRGSAGGGLLSPDDVHFVNWPSWCKSHYCEHVRRRDPIRRWLSAVEARRADGGGAAVGPGAAAASAADTLLPRHDAAQRRPATC